MPGIFGIGVTLEYWHRLFVDRQSPAPPDLAAGQEDGVKLDDRNASSPNR